MTDGWAILKKIRVVREIFSQFVAYAEYDKIFFLEIPPIYTHIYIYTR